MAKRKLPVVKLALIGVVLAVGAVLVIRGVNVRELAERGVELIRAAGPVAFFASMAILPAFGAPLSAFTITAGEAFGAQMSLAGVIAVSLVMIAINLALGYWVARYALQPLLARLIARYGYQVPRVTSANALSVTLVVRLTPGPPFALQTFILGVAEVPFRLYMVVSWLALVPQLVGAVILGEGLFKGNFKFAAMGLGVLVIAVVAVQWIRRRYSRRES